MLIAIIVLIGCARSLSIIFKETGESSSFPIADLFRCYFPDQPCKRTPKFENRTFYIDFHDATKRECMMIKDSLVIFPLLIQAEKTDLRSRLRIFREEEIMLISKNRKKFGSKELPPIHYEKPIELSGIFLKSSDGGLGVGNGGDGKKVISNSSPVDPLSKRQNLPPIQMVNTRVADAAVSEALMGLDSRKRGDWWNGTKKNKAKSGSRLYMKIRQAQDYNFGDVFGQKTFGKGSGGGGIILTKNRKRKRRKATTTHKLPSSSSEDWTTTPQSWSYTYESWSGNAGEELQNDSSSEDWSNVMMSSVDRWSSSESVVDILK